jgi:hypothetical protein
MADPGLRLNGEHIVLTVNIGGTPFGQSQIVKSLTVEPKVVDHDDDFLGDDASSPDQQVRGWTGKFDAFVVDTALQDKLLQREAARVARQRLDAISIGIAVRKRDGTTASYVLQECEMPPVGINASGAAERVMQNYTVRARRFRKVV